MDFHHSVKEYFWFAYWKNSYLGLSPKDSTKSEDSLMLLEIAFLLLFNFFVVIHHISKI